MKRWNKEDKDREFECRQCGLFLDGEDLIDGKCPSCENDEDLFDNSLNEDE
jgi:rubrerythrin